MLVGPGVIEATKANNRKGRNVGKEANIAGNSGEDHEPDLHKPTVQLSGRFEQRLRYSAGVRP
ncbi:hypothetical protein D3C81_2263730 [compost metagenome]